MRQRRDLGEKRRKTSGPMDLGPVVSVAPDPGDQPWELDMIPTAHCPVSLSSTSILWGKVRSEGKGGAWSLEKGHRASWGCWD